MNYLLLHVKEASSIMLHPALSGMFIKCVQKHPDQKTHHQKRTGAGSRVRATLLLCSSH